MVLYGILYGTSLFLEKYIYEELKDLVGSNQKVFEAK